MSIRRNVVARFAALGVLTLVACGGPDGTPEAQIKSLVDRAGEAAEARDISTLADLVSDDYVDAHGYDRRSVLRIVQGLFLQNRKIHLLTLVRDLRVEGDSARLSVLAAMAGRPIESVQSLASMRAKLMRFDLELDRRDGDWLVRAADWRRAELEDFL